MKKLFSVFALALLLPLAACANHMPALDMVTAAAAATALPQTSGGGSSSSSSTLVAHVVSALCPRYHFASFSNVAYVSSRSAP